MSLSSVNLKQEQERLEDLYQNIFPFLLQTERTLREVAMRGQGTEGDRHGRSRRLVRETKPLSCLEVV